MRVDSITSGVSLNKLRKRSSHVTRLYPDRKDKHTVVMGMMSLENLDITIKRKDDKDPNTDYTIDQVSFFKWIDFIALLRLRTQLLDGYIRGTGYLNQLNIEPDTYLDPYDVQPCRIHLFETRRATAECFRILHSMGATDNNVVINNYDNIIEMSPNIFKKWMLLFSYWVTEWNELYEVYCEKRNDMLWLFVNNVRGKTDAYSGPGYRNIRKT